MDCRVKPGNDDHLSGAPSSALALPLSTAALSRSEIASARKHQVVIEFPTHEAALACYRSPEYQDASKYLKRGCDVDLVIIAGYDGEQP